MELFVKKLLSICVLSMLGALAGCAGVTANIAATGTLPAASAAATNYRFVETPAQADAGEPLPGEPLLRAGLAQRGFTEGAPDAARYLVSVAWATRPADVTVVEGDCSAGCEPSARPALPWFGRPYVHTLALRFFALPEGREVYKVSAVKRDRNADAQQAVPYLVTGALARLPFQADATGVAGNSASARWRVKLDDSSAQPAVLSIKPVTAQ